MRSKFGVVKEKFVLKDLRICKRRYPELEDDKFKQPVGINENSRPIVELLEEIRGFDVQKVKAEKKRKVFRRKVLSIDLLESTFYTEY